MTEASDQLILTFGSKTHSGLLTEKKEGISTERDTIKFYMGLSLHSIDFYLEFRFYWFLPDQLILTFGSKTHSRLSSQKKRIPTETDTIKF